jgi:hypothetical protein
MSSKPSKQLGALLGRVPSATVAGQHPRPAPVTYAPEQSGSPIAAPAVRPPVADDPEVPLQVLVPRHVRIQLDRMHAETRKPLRALTLEALRAIGIEVSDEDIAGKRGRKKP